MSNQENTTEQKNSNNVKKQSWSAWNASTQRINMPTPGSRFAKQNSHITPVIQPGEKIAMDEIRTVAFVGSSGTGKSHRAVEVARSEGISYIIDDGLLIGHNRVLEGQSAKLTKTKVGALKRAVFFDEEECSNMMRAIRINQPDAILILGTSEEMVDKITARLGLPEISKTIYIEDVASEAEIEQAKKTRENMGKHVIPVATFQLKKEFSGLLIDSLKWMRWKGRVIPDYDVERSVVRPTFSMLGNYEISDTAVKQLVYRFLKRETSVKKVKYVFVDNLERGLYIRIEVEVEYGIDIRAVLKRVQKTIGEEVHRITALYIHAVDVMVSGVSLPND